jgi:hypothetical protein
VSPHQRARAGGQLLPVELRGFREIPSTIADCYQQRPVKDRCGYDRIGGCGAPLHSAERRVGENAQPERL